MIQKVAIPVSNGMLDAHFGHCRAFAIFEIENKQVVNETIIDAPPHEPGLLPKFLADKGVTDIIAGGMGQRAIQLFKHAGVNVFVGAPKMDAKNLIDGFINKKINFTANYCDH
jgi:predicted Fe-Mo cluster-binding NifX family protein